MSKLLQINSSGKGPMSTTAPLTEYFADQWKKLNANQEVISRDLLISNLPLVTPELIGAFYTPEENLTVSQKLVLAISNELIAELFAADTYVFGVPMYNFGVPGVFKVYIDQIVRMGKTFTFADGSPQGLLKGKRLIVITASGADYSESPMKEMNFVEPYLRALFGFIGVTNIEFIDVPGRDPQSVAAASEIAKKRIDKFLAAEFAQSR